MRNALPGAPAQSIGAFQTGDPRLDTCTKIPELTIDPQTLGHGFNAKPTLLVKGNILDSQPLGGFQIGATGIAAPAWGDSHRVQ